MYLQELITSSSWYRATQWAGRPVHSGIMIIDDTVANNELTKASMKLARPTGMAIPSLPRKQL